MVGGTRLSDLARPGAVLLDIDGTRADSNYLHVEAWSRAFARVGAPVESWRIHAAIGMDSDALRSELLGEDADRLGEAVSDAHSEVYAELSVRLRRLPGVHDLLDRLRDEGTRVVLATSAPPEELERLRAVLEVEDALTAVTTADDVDTAKPAPDIVAVALERAGVDADRAVFVGDTVWDVEAAGRAGVPCIAVRSGGIGARDLRDAGALAVYRDPADIASSLTGDDRPWLRPSSSGVDTTAGD